MALTEDTVVSASGEYTRPVWLLESPSPEAHKLCVFLDAEYYLARMDAPAVLLDLQARAILPPVTCLFVSQLDNAARHQDYACNPRFSAFIAHDLLAWARERNPGLSEGSHLICGLSLSGLASAYLTLTYPHLFSAALSQSGSFWWNQEWLTGQVKSAPATHGKFWLSVGDQETASGISHPPTEMRQEVSQIQGVENLAEELTGQGRSVRYHLFSGGHDFGGWKNELSAALEWLIGENAHAHPNPG